MSFGEGNLRERVEQLERERDYWKRTCVKNAHALAFYINVANDTRAENDKLRQLVRDLERCRHLECHECEHYMGDSMCAMQFFDHMAKLGIEVE